jgi:multidrug efflux pump subunit AcrA (membrane-fusion protein)
MLVMAAGGAVWFFLFRGPPVRVDLVVHRVAHQDLHLKVVERGTLEAVNNHDIKCDVRPGLRGNPKIMWVVDNGKLVEAGELLVEIDDSALQEQAQGQKVARDKAQADMISAEQNYPITQVQVKLAELALEKWQKGDFPQQQHDLEGQIQMADSDRLQEQDRAAWAARMVKKGYMTASQQEAEQSKLRGLELNLQKVQELKKVLTEYTNVTQTRTLQNNILDATAKERAALSLRDTNRAVFQQQDQQLKDYLRDIEKCKIRAPIAGLVVYFVPEQTRMGSGATQSIIAQGEPVQYGQKLLSVPDLTQMQVNVRIHEAAINAIREGLLARVRVDAAPDKLLHGHVKGVDNIAAQQDWMSPDVKIYKSLVVVDDDVAELKLKPGLSAEVTILSEAQVKRVLAVPLHAVLRPAQKGSKPRCFVLRPEGPEAREVDLGLNDEWFVEIKRGLEEGEEVVLNPRALLSEKEKRAAKEDDKVSPATDRGGAASGERGAKDSLGRSP